MSVPPGIKVESPKVTQVLAGTCPTACLDQSHTPSGKICPSSIHSSGVKATAPKSAGSGDFSWHLMILLLLRFDEGFARHSASAGDKYTRYQRGSRSTFLLRDPHALLGSGEDHEVPPAG